MDELLTAVLAVFLEFLLELGGEIFLDVLARAGGDAFKSEHPQHPAITWVACMFLGVLAGGISIIFLPYPLFRSRGLHGISLVIAPVATGILMSRVGAFLRQRNKSVVLIESFPYAFAFAFGMAAVRYVHAHGISLTG